jgi:hypothetical protein
MKASKKLIVVGRLCYPLAYRSERGRTDSILLHACQYP